MPSSTLASERAAEAGSDYRALVAPDYEVVTGLGGGGWIAQKTGAETTEGPADMRGYYPSLTPNLPTELAKLVNVGDSDILGFARRWGLLGFSDLTLARGDFSSVPQDWKIDLFSLERHVSQMFDAESVRDEDTDRMASGAGYWEVEMEGRQADPVRWILAHARGIDIVLEWLSESQQPREADLDRLLAKGSDTARIEVGVEDIVCGIPMARDVEAMDNTLARLVELNLASVSRRVGSKTKQDGLFHFGAVIQFAYWHLANLWAGSQALIQCADNSCGAWFAQTDRRQRFCPPAPLEYKSRCGARYRKVKKRSTNSRRG